MRLFLFIVLLTINPSISTSQTTTYINSQLEQAQIYIEDHNYTQALSIFHNLISENPNDNNIYRNYAELLLILDQKDGALTNIQKALLLSKENPSNHIIAGNIYRKNNDFQKAQNFYNTAISLDPGLGSAYLDFSLLNIQFNHMREAHRLAKLAYQYNPQSWKNIIIQAYIAQKNNNFEQAQRIFLQGIRKFPYNEQLLDEFALFYTTFDIHDKAITILEEANGRFGESITRNTLLAHTLFYLKDYSKSLLYYEKIDSIYTDLSLKNTAHLKWRLYNLYKLNNQLDKSYIYLQKALELDPSNQLYLSTFYSFLISTNNTELRTALANHIKQLSTTQRQTGIGNLYLMQLYKILKLDPTDSKTRQKLINYAKMEKNQHLVSLLLDTTNNNSFVSKIVSLRKHLSTSQRINTNKQKIYQYTNKIFIKDISQQFGNSIRQELTDLEFLYPNIYSDIELKKDFIQESRTMFQNNTNNHIVTSISIDSKNSILNIEVYDKTGLPVTSFKNIFTDQQFTKNLITYTKNINNILPTIGFINKRLPDFSFEINIGSKDKLSTNSILTILDKNFNPLTTASITKLTPHSAIIKQLSTPSRSISIDSALVTPIEYTPSINTNTNTITINVIKDIKQVSQQLYSNTISLE